MSAIVRAPRKASRKRSVALFSAPNSSSLISSMVHDRTEASSRPIMTILTTAVASMNMETGVMPPPWPPETDSLTVVGSAAGAAASAAGAAASAAGAAVDAAAAGAAAGVAASCARTGELAIRTAAPAIARRIFVFLLSSIVRQFLLWSDTWNPRHGPRQSAVPIMKFHHRRDRARRVEPPPQRSFENNRRRQGPGHNIPVAPTCKQECG
ncbi:hypothetical protein D3C72_972760 [compost metagenome]